MHMREAVKDVIAKDNERFLISGRQEEIISYNGSTGVADFVVMSVSSNITKCVGPKDNHIPEGQELVLAFSSNEVMQINWCLYFVHRYFSGYLHSHNHRNA